jgi:glycerophosphoryl diester phosphodiesterase
MGSYNRRTFLKKSALVVVTAASNRMFFPSVIGRTVHNPVSNRSSEILVSGNFLKDAREFNTIAQETTNQLGANHPFFTQGKNRLEVIAHQGGKGQWPGETLYAYEQATKLGVDILELDIHSTSDGALVLMHNDRVDETTNKTGLISRFRLKDLKKLDAGYRWTADGGKTFPFRGKGITVPTLEEVFKAFPHMRMNIEIKQSEPSLVASLHEMINLHKMTDKVLVASFSHEVLRDFRRNGNGVATSASTQELLEFRLGNNSIVDRPSRPDALQMKDRFLIVRLLTERFVERAHHARFNLPVHAWTVNDIDGMRRMTKLGVDGIITDYPGPLLALLGRLQAA